MGLGGFGMGEMIFIFLIVLLLFGAKRLPEIGSSLGKGIKEFKSSVRDIEKELSVPEQRPIHRPTPPPPVSGSVIRDEGAEGEPRKLSDGVASSSAEEKV
jgi:sec-independent protein translocase protein TatA